MSLPDNNVQNGASCMNHYLQPGVLLMNMHEPREGEERFAQPVSWRSLRGFHSMLWVWAFRANPNVCLTTHSLSSLSEHLFSVDGECPVTAGSPLDQGNAAVCSFMSRELNRELEGSGNGSSLTVSFRNSSWRQMHASSASRKKELEMGVWRAINIKERQMLCADCSCGEWRRLFPNEQLHVK